MTAPTPRTDRPPAADRPASKLLSAQSPILPVALLAIGGYLTWFGVHYWRTDTKWPTDPIKALLTGQPLPQPEVSTSLQQQEAIAAFQPEQSSTAGAAASTLPGGGNAAIAADALKYQGAGYQFGGRADQVGNWDCSSFVFYVLAHDLGLSVLGGRWGSPGYPPHAHGPVAQQFKLYGTAVSAPAAGDIVAWNTHVGIAIDSTRIVAARTPAEGTGISSIAGTSQSINETPVFRRVTLISSASPTVVNT